jgi:hypothetical protein
MATWNFTLTNIQAHAETAKTEPETATQQQTALKTQTETQNPDCKNFFQHST